MITNRPVTISWFYKRSLVRMKTSNEPIPQYWFKQKKKNIKINGKSNLFLTYSICCFQNVCDQNSQSNVIFN